MLRPGRLMGGGQGLLPPIKKYDFRVNRSLGSEFTFSRASVGRYTDVAAVIQSAAIDVARFDYNASASPLGLMNEESRTNLLLRSEAFDHADWTKPLPGNGSVTANTGTAPDGTTTMDTISWASGGDYLLRQNVTVANDSVTRCYSIFLKGISGSNADIQFVYTGGGVDVGAAIRANLTAGSISVLGGTPVASGIIDCGGGIYRAWFSYANNSSGHTNAQIDIRTSAVGTAIQAWGAQFEVGAFPTSYIATTSATVTRSADVCDLALGNGDYDIFVADADGSEWRDVTVSGGSYRLSPRSGKNHIAKLQVFQDGRLSTAQKAAITAHG